MPEIIFFDNFNEKDISVLSALADISGYEIEICSSREELIAECRKDRPLAIFFSPEILDKTPMEFSMELNSLKGGFQIKKIALLSDIPSDFNDILRMTVDDFVIKPFSLGELAFVININLGVYITESRDKNMIDSSLSIGQQYIPTQILTQQPLYTQFLCMDKERPEKKIIVNLFIPGIWSEDNAEDAFLSTLEKVKGAEFPHSMKFVEWGKQGKRVYTAEDWSKFIPESGESGFPILSLNEIVTKNGLPEYRAVELAIKIFDVLKYGENLGIGFLYSNPQGIKLVGKEFIFSPTELLAIPIGKTVKNKLCYKLAINYDFIAPELIFPTDEPNISRASTVYILGGVLSYMVTGINIFHREKPCTIFSRHFSFIPRPLKEELFEISDIFSSLIEGMLLKEPNKRPGTETLTKSFSELYDLLRNKIEEQRIVRAEQVKKTKEQRKFLEDKRREQEELQIKAEEIKKVKKRRLIKNRILMLILCIVSMGIAAVVTYFVFNSVSGNKNEIYTKGALVSVTCTKCGYTELRHIKNIATAVCSRCGAPVGYTWECRDCKYKFPFVPKPLNTDTIQEYIELIKEQHQCPACGSDNTGPVRITAKSSQQK